MYKGKSQIQIHTMRDHMVCCAAGFSAPEDIAFSFSCSPSMDIETITNNSLSQLSIYYRST